ncbi:xanthine dehydrogenase family protein molybdopterin-binding subunit [bacterium]|nr:xanthine dehydrogenase family protein molybdopterin-binding subunit [bacterium]
MMKDTPASEMLESECCEPVDEQRSAFQVSRRGFLQLLGSGLLITVTESVSFGQSRATGSRRSGTVGARLHIGQDGRITVMTGKVEIGQGSRAQLTQAAAEELRVSVDQIRLVMADTALVPNDGTTAGSRTTPSTVPAVRRGAATARELLTEMACERWKVDRGTVKVREGAIVHPATGRKITYAALAGAKDIAKVYEAAIPRDVEVTPVSEWEVLGTSVPRPNRRDLVTGAHRFPSDIVRPRMLYGKILRPPSYGATLSAIDLSEAKAMDGVVVVRDGNFVGCAAPTSFRAAQAVQAIAKTASWKAAPHPSSKELFSYLKNHARSGGGGRRGSRGGANGSVEDALEKASKVLREVYGISYIQHAPMEPRAAVAEWNDGTLAVWTGSQAPNRVHSQLAQAFGIESGRVRVIIPDMGGGFGGKHTGEVAVEAARLAKGAGRPVSLRWSREEEFIWAYFRPAGVIEIQAGLDANGLTVAWDFTNINSGGAAIASPYEIRNKRTQFLRSDPPLRQGSYRCLAATANNFARESFMDELAAAAGADPLAFRLAHIENARLRAVLETAAKRFRFSERKGKNGQDVGVGLACGTEKGSYVAACVEVSVDRKRGSIDVRRVCEVFECGAIQNPDNLRSQVEGCIIMGLGGALTEEIQFENGKVLNPSFRQYQVPRFADVPELDIHLLDRPDLPSAGGGETPIIAIAPAIANAVFEATGIRIRCMPIRGVALKQG